MPEFNEQIVTIPEGRSVRIIVSGRSDWPQKITLTSEAGGRRWEWRAAKGADKRIYAGATMPGSAEEHVPSPSVWVSIWHSPNGGVNWSRSNTQLVPSGAGGARFTVVSKDGGSSPSGDWDDAVVSFHWL